MKWTHINQKKNNSIHLHLNSMTNRFPCADLFSLIRCCLLIDIAFHLGPPRFWLAFCLFDLRKANLLDWDTFFSFSKPCAKTLLRYMSRTQVIPCHIRGAFQGFAKLCQASVARVWLDCMLQVSEMTIGEGLTRKHKKTYPLGTLPAGGSELPVLMPMCQETRALTLSNVQNSWTLATIIWAVINPKNPL